MSDIVAFSINLRTKCVFLVMFRPPLPPCTHLYALVLTPPPPLDAYVINGRPLIDTIFSYSTDLQLNKNNKLNTISLYVDFKKAFDTVNHKLLIQKLPNFDIKNKTTQWIGSYLSERTQQTQIGDTYQMRERLRLVSPKAQFSDQFSLFVI